MFLNKIKIKLSWHKWPDVSIISVYEFISYLLVLFCAIFLYNSCQRIPFHADTFTVHVISNDKSDTIIPDVNIEYYIPLSKRFNNGKKTGNIRIALSRSSKKCTLFFNGEVDEDSLLLLATPFFTESNDISKVPSLCYIKFKQANSIFKSSIFFKTYDWKKGSGDCFYIEKLSKSSGEYVHEALAPFKTILNVKDISKIGPLSQPKAFYPYDISQSYFYIKFDGEPFHGRLTLDFVGATEFSKMYPEPDKISMSSVEFSDSKKIEIIRNNGLKFHARFKEYEGIQNSRMFVLSAILSALFAIFITFVILASYKIKRHLNLNKT